MNTTNHENQPVSVSVSELGWLLENPIPTAFTMSMYNMYLGQAMQGLLASGALNHMSASALAKLAREVTNEVYDLRDMD